MRPLASTNRFRGSSRSRCRSRRLQWFECEDCGNDFATFTEAEACEQSCKTAKAPPAKATPTVRAGHEPYKPPRKPPALTHRPGYPDLGGLPAPLRKTKETAPVTSPATMQPKAAAPVPYGTYDPRRTTQPKAAAPVATPVVLPKAEMHMEKIRSASTMRAHLTTRNETRLQTKLKTRPQWPKPRSRRLIYL